MVLPRAMAPVPPSTAPTRLTNPRLGPTGDTTVLQKARHRTGPVGPTSTSNAQSLGRKAAARRRRGLVWLALVVALAIAAITVGWWFNTGPGAQAAVPSVANTSVAQATSTLEASGFTVSSSQVKTFDASVAAGQVMGTRPRSGATVQKGSRVELVVSQGPRILPLPHVVGEQEAAAKTALSAFTLQASSYRFDQTAAKGVVLSIAGKNASGATVDLGSATTYPEKRPVTLTVSLGQVPNVTGQLLSAAQATLGAVGLKGVQSDSQFSDSAANGTVIQQGVASSGPVVTGSTVDLVVSKGPAPVTVPDVTKLTLKAATAKLHALGLKVTYADCTSLYCSLFDWKSAIPVSSTSPAAGATAYKGDTVTLTYPAS
jgi:serine/threonine-protein kinase